MSSVERVFREYLRIIGVLFVTRSVNTIVGPFVEHGNMFLILIHNDEMLLVLL